MDQLSIVLSGTRYRVVDEGAWWLDRDIAAREHIDSFGDSVTYSGDTLDRCIRRFRAGGFPPN
jgi:hypothetical protein